MVPMMATNAKAPAQETNPFLRVVIFTLRPSRVALEQSRCHSCPKGKSLFAGELLRSAWTYLCKTLQRTYLEAFVDVKSFDVASTQHVLRWLEGLWLLLLGVRPRNRSTCTSRSVILA